MLGGVCAFVTPDMDEKLLLGGVRADTVLLRGVGEGERRDSNERSERSRLCDAPEGDLTSLEKKLGAIDWRRK